MDYLSLRKFVNVYIFLKIMIRFGLLGKFEISLRFIDIQTLIAL